MQELACRYETAHVKLQIPECSAQSEQFVETSLISFIFIFYISPCKKKKVFQKIIDIYYLCFVYFSGVSFYLRCDFQCVECSYLLYSVKLCSSLVQVEAWNSLGSVERPSLLYLEDKIFQQMLLASDEKCCLFIWRPRSAVRLTDAVLSLDQVRNKTKRHCKTSRTRPSETTPPATSDPPSLPHTPPCPPILDPPHPAPPHSTPLPPSARHPHPPLPPPFFHLWQLCSQAGSQSSRQFIFFLLSFLFFILVLTSLK